MARRVLNLKFLIDDAPDHRSVPNARSKTVVERPAIDDFPQSLLLFGIQQGGTAGPLALQQCFIAKGFIVAQPLRDFGSGRLQKGGNLSAAASIVVEQQGMQTLGNAIGAVGLGLFSPAFQSAASLKMQPQDSSAHPRSLASTRLRGNTYVPLFMSVRVLHLIGIPIKWDTPNKKIYELLQHCSEPRLRAEGVQAGRHRA